MQANTETNEKNKTSIFDYYPIFLITAYIIGAAAINNFHNVIMRLCVSAVSCISYLNKSHFLYKLIK